MPDDTHIDRIWEIIEKVGVCMLTTRFGGGLRARPLEARPDRGSDHLLFMTDAHSPKRAEIEASPDVGLTFVDTNENAYLSNDIVWWPGGANDLNACVLVVEPTLAELWDGPSSKAVAAYEFAKARATGTKPNVGENRKVIVDMEKRD
jgi:general stress protein 26